MADLDHAFSHACKPGHVGRLYGPWLSTAKWMSCLMMRIQAEARVEAVKGPLRNTARIRIRRRGRTMKTELRVFPAASFYSRQRPGESMHGVILSGLVHCPQWQTCRPGRLDGRLGNP
jgi:hypothetical protein